MIPVDAADPVADESFPERLDDRNAARDAGFVDDVDPGGFGGGEDLLSVEGEKRLVGGDHAFPGADGVEDEFLRDRGSADQFDHDVGFGDGLGGVGGEHSRRNFDAAVGCDVEVGDPAEHEFDAGASGDHVAVGEEIGGGPGSDGAESDNSDSDFFHDCGFPMRILKIVKLLSKWIL